MEPLSPFIPLIYEESGKMSPSRVATSSSSINFTPIPQVTASAWSIINGETGEYLWGKGKDSIRDIASLTKMMTMLVTKSCIRQKICNENDIVTVPKEATLLGGTTAYLKTDDCLKVIDLLYAMMLPSGNDAAYTLADFCGSKMLRDPKINKKKSNIGNVEYFVKQMNGFSRTLGMKNTKFLNPHGLSHLGNQSTVAEIGKLGAILMSKPLVRQIVAQKKHFCEVKNGNTTRRLTWYNTNLLLGKPGVTGLKTGQTPTAGPCLCMSYNVSGYKLIITLLKSRTADKRWSEANKLLQWGINQLDNIFVKFSDKNIKMRNLSNFINSLE
jgi:serine-type D-Ala-D-Ala carboxypeptidase (penicillin-binding protein 5/6)